MDNYPPKCNGTTLLFLYTYDRGLVLKKMLYIILFVSFVICIENVINLIIIRSMHHKLTTMYYVLTIAIDDNVRLIVILNKVSLYYIKP